MPSTVSVALKDGCFVNFTVAGTTVELLFTGLGTTEPQLAITTTKKVSTLRVMQDLLHAATSKTKPTIAPGTAGDVDPLSKTKRA